MNKKFKKIIILMIIVFILCELVGLNLKEGDEIGYALVCYYIVFPITSIICGTLLAINNKLKYSIIGLVLNCLLFGIVSEYLVFHNIEIVFVFTYAGFYLIGYLLAIFITYLFNKS
ncbi:MAG: hypothetical protein LBR40_01910 [Bacilli bacterium]|jgi:hypothetical protein|nr:hypothetical protein [Bacilli bacterium]